MINASGMDPRDGKAISGLPHLLQSCRTILTTPIGSRVMRRDFGSLLPDLIDKPMSGHTRMQVLAASAMALHRWEPRLTLQRLELVSNGPSLTLTLNCTVNDHPAELEVVIR